MSADPLKKYRRKRHLDRSPEPAGARKKRSGGPPIFVIHKHAASSLHYDFRLEADGVLKSWAVPKGPSTDPRERRLAVRTEDHPLQYADFEGVIPEGEYGAGTVMLWDIGPYRNIKEAGEGADEPPSVARQVEEGHVTIWLDGKKLRGGYALTRMQMGGDGDNWLLVKMDDDEADARRNPVSAEPDSAKSGRTMEEIREQEQPASGGGAEGKEGKGKS
ncbi:MAG: DNA polymerase ligase N-terminal domain-containing protein [Phycisphaerales bacterium JB039]